MSPESLDVVARAMFEARFNGAVSPSGATYDELVNETRQSYLAMAKAAVRAQIELEETEEKIAGKVHVAAAWASIRSADGSRTIMDVDAALLDLDDRLKKLRQMI
jgi:hypothetical protein